MTLGAKSMLRNICLCVLLCWLLLLFSLPLCIAVMSKGGRNLHPLPCKTTSLFLPNSPHAELPSEWDPGVSSQRG